jgi:hypothetical protein
LSLLKLLKREERNIKNHKKTRHEKIKITVFVNPINPGHD